MKRNYREKDVIIALDLAGRREAEEFLDLFADIRPFVKVGMELFYAEGPEIVRMIKSRGCRLFLDLKLHDIPSTVEKAMNSLAGLDIDMTNLHAAGGIKMMEWGRRGLTGKDGRRPLLLGVTQLTSTSRQIMNDELLISGSVEEAVLKYAANARTAGLDGVVCSPLESAKIHKECGKDFLTVTPGVRFAADSRGDQQRVMTPAQAAAAGSDLIVMGRSIIGADDPVGAYRRAVHEFTGGSR